MSDLGKRIKKAREATRPRLSLAKVGAAMSPPITAQSVHKWELGKSSPSARDLDTLARLTGKSVKWFLYGVEDGAIAEDQDKSPQVGRAVTMVEFASIPRYLAGEKAVTQGVIRTNFPCSNNSFQTYILDDANHPELYIGDSVVIDMNRAPLPGKFCLAIHEGEPVIGRYRPRKTHIEIVPVNDHWPTIEVELGAVIGAVSEISRSH